MRGNLMGSTSRADVAEMSDYASLLRRRWWVVSVGVALGVALAALAVVYLPDVYTAKAVVLVTSGDPAARDSEVNMDTEAGRVRGAEVAKKAQELYGTTMSPEDLVQNLTVSIPKDSGLLEIAFEAPAPAEARDGAAAFANAYLATRRARMEARTKRQINALQEQLNSLGEQLRNLPKGQTDERNLVTSQQQAFTSKLADAKISAAEISTGEIITLPALPKKPSYPDPRIFLPGGLLVGVLLGVGVAIVVDKSDKRLRSGRDVERVIDANVLLELPATAKTTSLGLLSARSRVGQYFHELCHAMTARLDKEPGRQVIVVAGTGDGKGGSVVAVNVAAALARTGADVTFVNADLSSEVSGVLLGVADKQGLAEVLLGTVTLSEVETRAKLPPSLRVIPRGMEMDVAADMLQGERMARIIESLRDRSRYIVVEAAPTSAGADAQALAYLADMAILVVETPKSSVEGVRDALRQMERVGSDVPGVVVIPAQRGTNIRPPAELATYQLTDKGAANGSIGSDEDGLSTATFPVVKEDSTAQLSN